MASVLLLLVAAQPASAAPSQLVAGPVEVRFTASFGVAGGPTMQAAENRASPLFDLRSYLPLCAAAGFCADPQFCFDTSPPGGNGVVFPYPPVILVMVSVGGVSLWVGYTAQPC